MKNKLQNKMKNQISQISYFQMNLKTARTTKKLLFSKLNFRKYKTISLLNKTNMVKQ